MLPHKTVRLELELVDSMASGCCFASDVEPVREAAHCDATFWVDHRNKSNLLEGVAEALDASDSIASVGPAAASTCGIGLEQNCVPDCLDGPVGNLTHVRGSCCRTARSVRFRCVIQGALPSHRSNGLLRHSFGGEGSRINRQQHRRSCQLGSTVITAASVYGEVGNDVISLGAVGRTAVATASISAANKLSGRGANTGAAITLSGHLVGSSTYTHRPPSQLVSIWFSCSYRRPTTASRSYH